MDMHGYPIPPSPNQQAMFYQQYEAGRRDEVVGILLALFLGGIGMHHFYLRRNGLGILYILFCWTGIPSFIALIECFFMPGRVRNFNAIQAASLAAMLGMQLPLWGQPMVEAVNVSSAAQAQALMACEHCQRANAAGSRFCSGCGAAFQV